MGNQTSTFRKPAFEQTATPAFVRSSMPTTPAFIGDNNTGSGGFGSFTSQGPAKFGTTGFSFGVANSTMSSPASTTMVQSRSQDNEAELSDAAVTGSGNGGGMGGLSLGGLGGLGGPSTSSGSGAGTNSVFGL